MILFLTWILFSSSFLWANESKLLNQWVGRVGEEMITLRDIQLSELVGSVLFPAPESTKPQALQLSAAQQEQGLAKVLLEWAVYKEAQAIALAVVSKEEVLELTAKVNSKLAPLPQWRRLEVEGGELHAIVLRKVRASRFIEFKTQAAQVPITDLEALDYFEKNRSKFGTLPFERFRAQIKIFLSREQAEKRLKDWFQVIRKKYQVENRL